MKKIRHIFFVSVWVFLVQCTSTTYPTIGGRVAGLDGTLVLRNNGSDDLTITKSGAFTFATAAYLKSPYNVTIKTQPNDQVCVVKNGEGTTSDIAVTNIVVTCVDDSNPPPSARFLYVANGNFGVGVAVYVCTINEATGAITLCQDAGGGAALSAVGVQGIKLNTDSSTAYLTNGNGDADIYQCPINVSDGTFGTCVTTPITTPVGYDTDSYGMLALNTANTFAYLADTSNNRIDTCPVSAGVISGACAASALPALSGNSGEGITINKADDKMYVADYGAGIYVCDVSGATISSCVLKTGGGAETFTSIADVALNPSEDLLYATSYSTNEVFACDTTPNGTNLFDNCVVATNGVPNAGGVVINAKNTVAYVSTFGTEVYSCPILAGGTFDGCTATSGFNGAIGLVLGY